MHIRHGLEPGELDRAEIAASLLVNFDPRAEVLAAAASRVWMRRSCTSSTSFAMSMFLRTATSGSAKGGGQGPLQTFALFRGASRENASFGTWPRAMFICSVVVRKSPWLTVDHSQGITTDSIEP